MIEFAAYPNRNLKLWIECPNGHIYKVRHASARYRICGICGEVWQPESEEEMTERNPENWTKCPECGFAKRKNPGVRYNRCSHCGHEWPAQKEPKKPKAKDKPPEQNDTEQKRSFWR